MTVRNPSKWLAHMLGPIDFQAEGVDAEVERRGTINLVGLTVADDPDNDRLTVTAAAGSTPTGTGIPHVVAGVQDAAASLIVNADVHASAAIAASKVVQATGTGIPHVVAGVLSAASSLIVDADVTSVGVAKITNLGANVATFLGTPTTANLLAAVTGETGSGAVVFGTAPTISDPTITGTVTYQGTKLRILSIPGEARTTTATTVVVATFTMIDETSCKFDFTAGMKAVGAVGKAGGWTGSATYRRTAGGAPTICGAAAYGTAEESTAGDDVTFDVSGNAVRVLATAADGDDRNWTCEFRVHETLATA